MTMPTTVNPSPPILDNPSPISISFTHHPSEGQSSDLFLSRRYHSVICELPSVVIRLTNMSKEYIFFSDHSNILDETLLTAE